MSVVAPAVYVGTWHKYNCGSIAGRWFDLTTFDDERDFFAACRALHQDEADPELMFQDYEGFPGNMASECHINWAWVEGFRRARDEGCEEAYRLWVDDTGETDFDSFRDAWWGEADSEEAFAVEFASDTGLLADVPETVALYFDYEMTFTANFILDGKNRCLRKRGIATMAFCIALRFRNVWCLVFVLVGSPPENMHVHQ